MESEWIGVLQQVWSVNESISREPALSNTPEWGTTHEIMGPGRKIWSVNFDRFSKYAIRISKTSFIAWQVLCKKRSEKLNTFKKVKTDKWKEDG